MKIEISHYGITTILILIISISAIFIYKEHNEASIKLTLAQKSNPMNFVDKDERITYGRKK